MAPSSISKFVDKWNNFINSDQFEVVLNHFKNDLSELNSLYDSYLEDILLFIDNNYPGKSEALRLIVNKDLSFDCNNLYLKEIKEKKNSFNNKGLFKISYCLLLAENIEKLMIDENFNFQHFIKRKNEILNTVYKRLCEEKSFKF